MKQGIRLMVTTNKTQREIAKELQVSEQTVTSWKKNKEFDEIRLKYEREFLGDLSSLAIRTYKDILKNATSDHVKFLVSQDILNRSGHRIDNNDLIREKIKLENKKLEKELATNTEGQDEKIASYIELIKGIVND